MPYYVAHNTHTRAHIHYTMLHTHMHVQLLKMNHSPPPFLCALTLRLSSTALCVRITLVPRTGRLETILLVFSITRSLVEMTTVDSTEPLWLNWDQQKVVVISQPSTSLLSPVWVAPWCAVMCKFLVCLWRGQLERGDWKWLVSVVVLMCVVRPQQLTPSFLHNSATSLSMTAILVYK